MRSSKSRRRKKPDRMASLPDDIVVDILSRLPVKSLCRCKAVSRHWRDLIFRRDYIRKFPQFLPCLFYNSFDNSRLPKEARHFTNVWEGPDRHVVCPSLSFLPGYEIMSIVDSCNGEVLCRFSSDGVFRNVVCNPIKKTMVFLPDSGCSTHKRVVRLAEGHVFEFVCNVDDEKEEEEDVPVVGANIYSTETGAWSYKEGGWLGHPCLDDYDTKCVYFHGYLFIVTDWYEVLVVNMEGDIWCTILLPEDGEHVTSVNRFVGIYKEQLCYISAVKKNEMSIWILEDVRNYDWVMKHKVSLEVLREKRRSQYRSVGCYVIGILQDCNFILYTAEGTLMAYDVDGEEAHAIQNLDKESYPPYVLYEPPYPEELTNG